MKPTVLTPLLLAAGLVSAQHESDQDEFPGMGPVAFLWPPDREWGAAQDNTPPCGSAAGVTNRTDFPLTGGVVALVAQDESWLVQIAISHSNSPSSSPPHPVVAILTKTDPSSNSDFDTVTQSTRIPEIDEGHMCYPITSPGSDGAGANATIQIRYTSDFDTDTNSTFYACADISYVANSQFIEEVPCFNATIDDDNPTTTATSSASSGVASATSSSASAHSSGSSSLSGGAIAGIVVGVVCGVAIVLGALFFLWRRGQKYKRLIQTSFDKCLATLVQSILAGSKHAPLDSLKIGLCVSGGPDSMALASLVASLKEHDLGFNIDPVAFVIDHNARAEAGTEARTVTRWLSKLGIPSHIAKIEWDHPNPLQLPNFEGKARNHRYRLLTKLALDHGVRHLFLGHHRDDQLETIILRMIRNRSLSFMDLRGMESTAPVPVPYSVYGARHENPPVPMTSLLQHSMSESWEPFNLSKASRLHTEHTKVDDRGGRIMSYSPGGILVHRPFLDRTKAELVTACESGKVDFVTDKTNEDSTFTTRNAVRTLRTHQLPRALQADALLPLIDKSRQLFRLLQAEITAYMSTVKIVSFNFRSGVVYIRLPGSFTQLAIKAKPVAAGVLSQLCQFVSPNPTESVQTMVESDRLEEFVGHLQSVFWADPSEAKPPVFVNSRVLFEACPPREHAGSPDSYYWKLSRQPLRPTEIEPWLRERSDAAPFRLKWNVEYKVLPNTLVFRV
ncbi:hypothetical protein DV737_g1058, partial [Chaetothyriales sp. CBS 132003]